VGACSTDFKGLSNEIIIAKNSRVEVLPPARKGADGGGGAPDFLESGYECKICRGA
jgi:hypothetical protein